MDCNLISRNYLNAITANGYGFLIDEPTRVSHESATCTIDHYITKNIVLFQSLVMEAENFTDHYPIYLQFFCDSVEYSTEKVFRDTSFLNNKEQVLIYQFKLSHELAKCKLSDVLCVDEAFERFQRTVLSVTDSFAPIKKSRNIKTSRPKWFSNT